VIVKYTGVGKMCDFRLNSPYISETVRDRPMIAIDRKSYAAGRSLSVLMTLRLERRDARVKLFRDHFHYARTVWPRGSDQSG